MATLGDRVLIRSGTGLAGEVVRVARDHATVLPETAAEGVQIGAAVELNGPATIAPDDSWIGRIVDVPGRPLDGRPLFRGASLVPCGRNHRMPPHGDGWAIGWRRERLF